MRTRSYHAALRATDAYISVMLLVFPLFTGFSGYSNITLSKYIFFTAATALWLAALAVLCIRGRIRPRLTPPLALCAALALWLCVSTAASQYRADCVIGAARYSGLVTWLLYCAIFAGVAVFGRRRRRYVYLLALSSSLCCLVAFAQLLGCGIFYPDGYNYYDGGVRYVGAFLGTIGNTNLLAAFLSLSVPACWTACALGFRAPRLLALSAALGCAVLAVSGSAGGMLAVCVSGAAAAMLLAGRGRLPRLFAAASVSAAGAGLALIAFGGSYASLFAAAAVAALAASVIFARLLPRRFHLRALLILGCAVIVAGLIAVYFFPPESGHLAELSSILHGELRGEFGSSRLMIWREVLSLVSERPLLGGGPGSLPLRIDIEFSRYFPELGQTLTSYTDNAHNVYLGLLADSGAPSLAAYIALMAVTLAAVIRGREKLTVAGAAIISAWTEAFFGLGLCLTAPMMWIVWGLIHAGGRAAILANGVDLDEQDIGAEIHIRCDSADNIAVSLPGKAVGQNRQGSPGADADGV